MKTLFALLILTTTIVSAQGFKPLMDYKGYVPETLSTINPVLPLTDYQGNVVNIHTLSFNDFNHTKTSVTVLDDTGQIGGFGVTAEKDDYILLYSFEHYVELWDANGDYFRIGAAIEIKVNLRTRKANLDLSDLIGLAINAEKKRVKGSMSLLAKGFSSDNIYGLFNISSKIDRSSVEQTVKNTGILISKFSDKTVNLKPVVLGHNSKPGML